jgi:xanthine dehydrogenase accessory factor
MIKETEKILIRGAGEAASAVAHKLARCHFRLCLTEIARPIAVSRGVSFCEAVYDGEKEVAGITARLISSPAQISNTWQEGKIPIMVDPEARVKDSLKPDILVNAIMAKQDTDTKITDAPLVIGLGPGFRVGRDAHMIVETNNSENLGKVLFSGEAEPNTGIPLEVAGLTEERVLRFPGKGIFQPVKKLGDMVTAGETVGVVGDEPVKAKIDGVVRALIRGGIQINELTKLGEVDPRGEVWLCYAIRPRMRTIAGGVLEAILYNINKRG